MIEAANTANTGELVDRLRGLAINALARMYRPDQQLFAFRLRRQAGRDLLEGVSRRYTAIVLIALANEPGETSGQPLRSREILAGQEPSQVLGQLLEQLRRSEDLGEVALGLWAARVWDHPGSLATFAKLEAIQPGHGAYPTVELAWALTALTVPGRQLPTAKAVGHPSAGSLIEQLAGRLKNSFNQQSGLFPHQPQDAQAGRLRRHVACFADLVYPILALAHHYRMTKDAHSLHAARRCAGCMTALQGPAGQWWWHFDVRTGRVVERYPVYAVHQDAMAPMALSALAQVSGEDHNEAIQRGLHWLMNPPELTESLVDLQAGVIWRKVARREPGKLCRSMQAAACGLFPALRLPGLNVLFPPKKVDFESRPYHMGWLLYAWPGPPKGPSSGSTDAPKPQGGAP